MDGHPAKRGLRRRVCPWFGQCVARRCSDLMDVVHPPNPFVVNPIGSRRFYRLRQLTGQMPLTADQNTLALYHFDEPSGDTLDVSGNGWTGTLQNGASRAESAPGLGNA